MILLLVFYILMHVLKYLHDFELNLYETMSDVWFHLHLTHGESLSLGKIHFLKLCILLSNWCIWLDNIFNGSINEIVKGFSHMNIDKF